MARADRPNIVFILTDDQAIWAAGCYGNAEIRTPNLDRIAATGVRFENYFVTVPVCSASRATLLTGRIPLPSTACTISSRVRGPWGPIRAPS